MKRGNAKGFLLLLVVCWVATAQSARPGMHLLSSAGASLGWWYLYKLHAMHIQSDIQLAPGLLLKVII